MRISRLIFLVVLSGAIVALLTAGIRHSYGLFLPVMTEELGWGRGVFGFAVALQTLLMGACTPFFGWLADRFGATLVLVGGALAYALGLLWVSQVATALSLTMSLGLVIGLATSATSMIIMVSAVGKLVSAERRSLAMGIVVAGASLGQVLVPPLAQVLIDGLGWSRALLVMGGMILLILPTAFSFLGVPGSAGAADDQKFSRALLEAGSHRGYLLLTAGFFVCGFHVSFIAVHFPAYIADHGLPPILGATALILIGLFNIFGSFTWGRLGDTHSKKFLLSTLYFSRAVVFAVFLVFPVTPASIYLFSAVIGFLWLGTVPLTSGLVAQIFGVRYLSTLFGMVFFSHQVGGFLGAWLGGFLYDLAGSYDVMWYISIALGLASTALHFPINDKAVERLAPATQVG